MQGAALNIPCGTVSHPLVNLIYIYSYLRIFTVICGKDVVNPKVILIETRQCRTEMFSAALSLPGYASPAFRHNVNGFNGFNGFSVISGTKP